MDSPERNQIETPVSKFEESSIFNYIDSLSPIKPVKYVDTTRSFNSLSFASLPSVFTSPHLNSQRESRFLRRHDFSDLPKLDFTRDDQTEGRGALNVGQDLDCSAHTENGFDHINPELHVEVSQTFKYDPGRPESASVTLPTQGVETGCVLENAGMLATLNQFVEEASIEMNHSLDSEVELQNIFYNEPRKEERMGCEDENWICDSSNLLIYDSQTALQAPIEQDKKWVNHESSCFTSFAPQMPQNGICDLLHAKESACEFSLSVKHEVEDVTGQVGENDQNGRKHQTMEHGGSSSIFHIKQDSSDPSENISKEAGSHFPLGCKLGGGLPRRCLVFEIGGTQKMNFGANHDNSFPVSFQCNGDFFPDEKKLIPISPTISSSTRSLPAIGLHLNALAGTPKECRVVKHETLTSGNQSLTLPSSVESFSSLKSDQEPGNKSLDVERLSAPDANGVQVEKDVSQSAFATSHEDLNQSAHKKKRHIEKCRRKVEHTEEGDACKRCNCKKSKCLKLYCECFAAGLYCVEPCSCNDCLNKPIHEDTVLATRRQIETRNPLAFAPKVITSSEWGLETGDELNKTPASSRANKAEVEEEESESYDKLAEEKTSLTDRGQNDNEDKYPENILPETPSLQLCRQSVQLLFSKANPSQSFVFSDESSPKLSSTSRTLESDSFRPHPRFGKHFQLISDGETPEILREKCSPIKTLKIASPNCKRVSPPHTELKVTPNRKLTRKLVLQSIPSLPRFEKNCNDTP
ncbi:hypothetical protein Sjap_006513 [Stephania japonica]|uniref:CRC domain-containing protein n=1 Tax=Stephania japonica TaxID=461633 RepID=A0AAP0K8J2_9MAGN